MLFERQRLLLSLTAALDDAVASTDFQKLLFLYTKEWEAKPSFEFVPYQFGSFSFSSYADKRRLIERGLLKDDSQRWVLTEKGRQEANRNHAIIARTRRFSENHKSLRGDSLIAEVYRRYPYYATRSLIAKRVLPKAADQMAISAAKPSPRGPGLVTIGYEGKSLENYLNVLLRDSVTILCDVRRNPLSRKYGFSKSTLAKACASVGIRYEHIPELGIASEDRQELKSQSDYDALFSVYKREALPLQTAALKKIWGWVQQESHRVALTCFEAQACQCHRHCVSDALHRMGLLEPDHL